MQRDRVARDRFIRDRFVRAGRRKVGIAAAVACAMTIFIGTVWALGPLDFAPTTGYAWLPAVMVFALTLGLMMVFLPLHRGVDRFGAANGVTLARGVITAWLAGLIGTQFDVTTVGWWVTGAALLALSLDGIDGYLARTQKTASPFGARFDMEIDALFILLMSYLVFEAGRAGPWVLLIGLMRYGFVAAGWLWPSLRDELPPSFRRKLVCIIQGGALTLCFVPLLGDMASTILAILALASLAWSFGIDILYLSRRRLATGSDHSGATS
ncbi:CDP-alcohol phosphatidyltransferase family protein [Fodinicurvata sp. EGI_FJ10296]|uniref:CDP-alcohol phosphatidyltransferase family protein n=1 Tax=Fodinicurvata sp. EGI_FJ10296 TaxID=3231908 RepID=UPI003451CCFF